MLDRRKITRTRVSKCAGIVTEGSLDACMVRDISALGACLALSRITGNPDFFDLTFDAARTLRKCRVVWRSESEIGVEFQ